RERPVYTLNLHVIVSQLREHPACAAHSTIQTTDLLRNRRRVEYGEDVLYWATRDPHIVNRFRVIAPQHLCLERDKAVEMLYGDLADFGPFGRGRTEAFVMPLIGMS